nr:hypothetical protein [Streptomyces musisoli]
MVVGVGAVQAARQDGERRAPGLGGGPVGGCVDAVRESGGDRVPGLGDGDGEDLRPVEGLGGGGPVTGHGHGAGGQLGQLLVSAHPQTERAVGAEVGQGGGPHVVRRDDELARQLGVGEFLTRLVLGQAAAGVVVDAVLPDLLGTVMGEMGGDLVGREVGGERGAGGALGQGGAGHGVPP